MKTVTFDDDAYAILKRLKTRPGESFSDVVKRTLGRPARIEDSAGAWHAFTKKHEKKLRDETTRAFGTTR